MFFTLFELLRTYIYGAGVALTPDMNLVLTFLATLGSLFVTLLPFFIIWFIIRRLF